MVVWRHQWCRHQVDETPPCSDRVACHPWIHPSGRADAHHWDRPDAVWAPTARRAPVAAPTRNTNPRCRHRRPLHAALDATNRCCGHRGTNGASLRSGMRSNAATVRCHRHRRSTALPVPPRIRRRRIAIHRNRRNHRRIRRCLRIPGATCHRSCLSPLRSGQTSRSSCSLRCTALSMCST